MKNKTTNKGITLIALVITIIVMLILVAVTISMAINGGLFNYAGKAVGETKNAVNEETEISSGQITVNNKIYNSIDEYINGGVTLFSKILPANYGEYVEYNIDYDKDNDISDDWRIFYKDENNVYLIASDYVALDKHSSAIYGYRSLNLYELGYTTTDTAIEFLLNKTEWLELKDDTVAEYVVGTPTVEMIINSWNDISTDNQIVLSKGTNGYYVNEEDETSIGIQWYQTLDGLYYVNKGTMPYENTSWMWVASKMANGVLCRSYNSGLSTYDSGTSGYVTGNIGGAYYVGVRPIVCLKNKVLLVDGEGTIENPYKIDVK